MGGRQWKESSLKLLIVHCFFIVMTLGSLFDGIGGFPLAASKVGITPVWASEIEAAPVSITKRHFPSMLHLGDITEINGADIEPVDIITFGSPCQDLSIAGRRAGLDGERSGLFIEALRVIKEMRVATNGKYPARIVWENVPGIFSSNEGKDFQTVIGEIVKIAEPGISIPGPSAREGWMAAGFVLGDTWSLAWRVVNSQYFGVPQRRRRVYLVGDFTGGRAGEILFECEGLQGDFVEGAEAENRIAANAGKNIEAAGFNGWRSVTGSLEYQDECSPCIQSTMPPNVLTSEQYTVDIGYSTDRIQMFPDTSVTLTSAGGGLGAKTGLYCLPFVCNGFGNYAQGEVGKTLLARDDITTSDLIATKFSVRRLTPLECERLQGYPDGWTEFGADGELISDNQRYKAIGNSVAVPCVVLVLSRCKVL
jgi:DNA (cytosine-5)-methyltransferase 1